MIDTARNFKSKELVFKILDAMAMYKLNTLHIHLSDDEAWRLEIPGFSELTEVSRFSLPLFFHKHALCASIRH